MDTIRRAGLGYHPNEARDKPAAWGLARDHKPVWLPRGIVVPTFVDDGIWKINVRQPLRPGDDGPKYVFVSGGSGSVLRNADTLCSGRRAMLVEGDIDALAVEQVAFDLLAVVAAGTTTGARRPRWLARLALATTILVSFDADAAGEEAAHWWLEALGSQARRWRPLWDDPAAMLQDGADLRAWVEAGLKAAGAVQVEPLAAEDRCWLCGGEVARYDSEGRAYCEAHADYGLGLEQPRETSWRAA